MASVADPDPYVLGLPDPDPLVRGKDPDHSILKENSRKNLDTLCFFDFFMTMTQKVISKKA